MTTYAQAIDEISGRFYTDWQAGTAAIVGSVPDVRWPGKEEPNTPDAAKYWARFSYQTVTDGQTTLRDGANGKRYTNNGIVFVQHFAPMSITNSADKLKQLAMLTRNAFRKKAATVWFRNARFANELVADGKFWTLTVVAEYQYDDIG